MIDEEGDGKGGRAKFERRSTTNLVRLVSPTYQASTFFKNVYNFICTNTYFEFNSS